jgi:hypothetical protein
MHEVHTSSSSPERRKEHCLLFGLAMLPDNVFRECNNELVYEEAWSRDKGQHGTWS